MNASKSSKQRSLVDEIGIAGLVLLFLGSEVTLSSLIAKLFGWPDQNEVNAILDVLLTTLSLTFAMAIVIVLYGKYRKAMVGSFGAGLPIVGLILGASILIGNFFGLGMRPVSFQPLGGVSSLALVFL